MLEECFSEMHLYQMHINLDKLDKVWLTHTLRVSAHALSSTAPCRSDDVETLVKVRLGRAHIVSLYM